MRFYSTNRQCEPVSFEDAIFDSLPLDGGLYFPEKIPILHDDWIAEMGTKEKAEIAFEIAHRFADGEIPDDDLVEICAETIDFDFPVVEVEPDIFSLELYHGPTWAFKDVGARFLSRCMAFFNRKRGRQVTILVATSGDTGGAVAAGFHGVEGIEVKILYPKGKVSDLQKKQLTSWGGNIAAFEVDGTFDDCQHLVKKAFLDKELSQHIHLSSANSINIARLIPQTFYYFFARQNFDLNPVICVPSGNYGNLSAGLIAWKMGLPVQRFIAASNSNNIVPDYLETGIYSPKPSIRTVANAMDVGDPSNFVRMKEIFNGDHGAMTRLIEGFHLDDEGICHAMRECQNQTGYVLDPHGAVAYQALKSKLKPGEKGVFLETAHPVKFLEVVEKALDDVPDYSGKISEVMHQKSTYESITIDFEPFKECLMG